MQEGTQSKLIEMYEAREAILNRINSDFVRPDTDSVASSVIDIDKFLRGEYRKNGSAVE